MKCYMGETKNVDLFSCELLQIYLDKSEGDRFCNKVTNQLTIELDTSLPCNQDVYTYIKRVFTGSPNFNPERLHIIIGYGTNKYMHIAGCIFVDALLKQSINENKPVLEVSGLFDYYNGNYNEGVFKKLSKSSLLRELG
jgi:hypothetical protein